MANVISLVSYKFLPAKVGGQKGIALFNKYFSRYVRLICITTKNNNATAAEGYEVLPILSSSPLRYINPFYFFSIRDQIKKFGTSHLLIEHPYYGWLGFLIKKFTKVKLVVHSHNIEGLRWKSLGKWWWKILWWYEGFTHRIADHNFFIQQHDLDYAVKHFRLDSAKCIVMTYGIEMSSAPTALEVEAARRTVKELHTIADDESILLFNGAFDYQPNRDALITLLNKINPLLTAKSFKYKLIICGRNIPEEITGKNYPNVVMAGFVDDISIYFKSAHAFLNPVVDGGGIKTKLVEALGYNCNAVSTVNGAVGVDPGLCNGKLLIVADKDWTGFAEKVQQSLDINADIPFLYFQHFYWGTSTKKAADFISA